MRMNNSISSQNGIKNLGGVFVSVVMAVYNGERFLEEAIESVLSQTHKNFEFIIVDDGSSDSTAAIVKHYMSQDKRIRYFYQDNAGVGAALNFGDGQAKAEIIARMDSDDIMLPQRLEKQINFLFEQAEASAVSCLAYYINKQGKSLGKSYSDLLTVQDCKQCVVENKVIICLHPGAMFRKEALKSVNGYQENIVVGHDFDLWNRLADNGYYVVVMPEILMKYRLHTHSLMSSFKDRLLESDWVYYNIKQRRNKQKEISFDEFKDIQKETPLLQKIRNWQNHMANFYYRSSGLFYGEERYLKFLLFLGVAFILHPKYVFEKVSRQYLGLR